MKRRVNLSSSGARRKPKARVVKPTAYANGKAEAQRKKEQAGEQQKAEAHVSPAMKFLRAIGRAGKWLLLTFLTTWSGR